jgi:hypothetical protein
MREDSMSEEVGVLLIVGGLLLAFLIFFVRWMGDLVIRLAGADHKVLREWSVDRGYFIGLGLALLLSSGISTGALLIATSVAFGIPVFSIGSCALGAAYFFLIFSLDRWLVSDQTAGYAPPDRGSRGGAGGGWFRNFFAELVKVAPRAAIVYFASALFADFILLTVFQAEIQEQTKVVHMQTETQYTSQIKAEVEKRTKNANTDLGRAATEKNGLDVAFQSATQAIATATQQRDSALAEKSKAGIRCATRRVYGTRVDPATGRRSTYVARTERVCPPEVQAIYDAYAAQVSRLPQTQNDLDKAKADIDKKYGVGTLTEYVSGGAEREVRKEWEGRQPELKDGLLVRMRSLDMLTSRPEGECNVGDSPLSDACVSRYSARADDMQSNLRFWILLLEMTPVIIKFVTAILPRRGYASLMAARDERARTKAAIESGRLRNEVRVEIERLYREERLKMEIETAGAEIELREIERGRQQVSRRRIRRKLLEEAPTVRFPPIQTGRRVQWRSAVADLFRRLKFARGARVRNSHFANRLSHGKPRVSSSPTRSIVEGGVLEIDNSRAEPRDAGVNHRKDASGQRVIDGEEYL